MNLIDCFSVGKNEHHFGLHAAVVDTADYLSTVSEAPLPRDGLD